MPESTTPGGARSRLPFSPRHGPVRHAGKPCWEGGTTLPRPTRLWGRTAGFHRLAPGSRPRQPAPPPHRISLRLAARLLRLPLKGGVIGLGARASRPHPVPLVAPDPQCDFAGSHHGGSNRNGQAEGDPRRRPGSTQVGEMAEAVPGFVRAGRPRSQEGIIPRITPPLRGSRRDQGGARSRAGGGQHPAP